MNPLQSVGNFIAKLKIDEIPPDTILEAKRAVLDCLGVSIAAVKEPCLEILGKFVQRMGGSAHSALLGTDIRSSPAWAALYNGTLAHVLDFDDSAGLHIPLHPSAPVLPAVMAVGESVGAGGRQVLEAYIAGIEVECKLAKGCSRQSYSFGWHATGIFGTMGAAAGCARLLGLTDVKVGNALGIALSQVGGVRQNFGTMVKPLHAGKAAMNGVMSALLAQDGFTASTGALDGTVGFAHLFYGQALAEECQSLGKPYHLAKGFNIKKYPSCHATHSAIDAVLELVDKYDIDYRKIQDITCRSHPTYFDGLPYAMPKTPLEAKFSMQFMLALACVYGEVNIRQFHPDMVTDKNVVALSKRVNFFSDPAVARPGSRVRIKLKNESAYSVTVEKPRGDIGFPLSMDEVQNKFASCASILLTDDGVQTALDSILHMEKLDRIGTLTDALQEKYR